MDTGHVAQVAGVHAIDTPARAGVAAMLFVMALPGVMRDRLRTGVSAGMTLARIGERSFVCAVAQIHGLRA